MKKIYQIILTLLCGLNLSGQSVWIDSIYIQPTSPTTEDTIRVIGKIRTASAGCGLFSSELDIDEDNNIIAITGCYTMGAMDTICPSIDTFLIGTLPEGAYQVFFAAKGFQMFVNPNGDCSSSDNETVKEAEIMVSGMNPTDNKTAQLFQFDLIENPVIECADFRIASNERKMVLVMADILGRKVTGKQIEGNYSQEISIKMEVGHLPSGIYFCYLENENGKSKTIKMIKK